MIADEVSIRPTNESDRAWMRAEMRKWWGDELVIVRGKKHYPAEMDGYIAEKDEEKLGLIILRETGKACEIMSLTTSEKVPGLGEKLINTAITNLRSKDVKRLTVVTTNDNINALRFYQQLGFTILAWRKNALEGSREIKPHIPLVGNYNIPIRDEIELEMDL